MAQAETIPREVPLVRIFLSSPGDVAEERMLARQFIDSELPKFPQFREKVKFELIAWDDPAARIPMLATETPQESVNAARPRPATCDIVIVILWSRMGTPLPDNLRKPTGEPYLSGTEWEYEDAVNSPQQSQPKVLVYRRMEEPKIGLRDPQKKEKEEQFERVEAFFAQLRSLRRGVNEYEMSPDFKTLLSQHLLDVLWRHLDKPRLDGPSGAPVESLNARLSIGAGFDGLWLRTQRTEYVNFLLVNPRNCQCPALVPTYSFVHGNPGLVSSAPPPSTIGVQPEDYEGNIPPHIPDGEMVIEFTVANKGFTALVTAVELELVEVLDLPLESCVGNFWPVLEAIEDTAVISKNQSTYPLFQSKALAYRDSEIDLLRVNVLIADSEATGVFVFRINVRYTTGLGVERIAQSDTYYLAKSTDGPTMRIPYEKAERPKESFGPEVDTFHLIDREDFWTDGLYYQHLLEFCHCTDLAEQDYYGYIRLNFWNAVMGGKRDEIQVNGFKRIPWDGAGGGPFQEVFVPVNPSQGRGYSSHGHPDVHIYGRRDTKEYDCLLLACKRLADTGSVECQRLACEFLIDNIRSTERRSGAIHSATRLFHTLLLNKARSQGVDVAGVIDTVPLLAFFRNELSFAYLVDFLSVEHEIVLANVAYVFNSVRYRKSASALLAIVKACRSYATVPALGALRLNGSPCFFSELVDICDGNRVREDESDLVASVLVTISKENARNFATQHLGSGVSVRRSLAFQS